jgi:hypothetical protein
MGSPLENRKVRLRGLVCGTIAALDQVTRSGRANPLVRESLGCCAAREPALTWLFTPCNLGALLYASLLAYGVPVPEFSDFIIFADESGDHGLVSIDPHFPVFVLAFCLFSKEDYLTQTVPDVLRFKFKHFGHDQVILHEHDIVKNKGPFVMLRDASIREPFLADLSTLVADAPMTIVASVIDKEKYRKWYSDPVSPYHVSMSFGLERLFLHLNLPTGAVARILPRPSHPCAREAALAEPDDPPAADPGGRPALFHRRRRD